jgi:hypothetical protein
MKTKLILLLLTVISINNLLAQDTLRVLFLGNSYTSYNNLPQLVQSLSGSAGKTLIIDSNMPGGYPISSHLNDATTFSKISQGNWDYVVIQEQSQIPTIDYYRYNDMYPALTDIKALVEQYNPCAKIITYMTWGRRFGGMQCDPNNTYCSPNFVNFNHMQDSLTSAYLEISEQLNIQCATVGVVWQNILNDTNLVLHSGDNSHPNIDGSYVAALTIFSNIWKLPTTGLSFNAGISSARTQYYQSISDQTIFSNPERWNLYINNPIADFTYSISGNTLSFINSSISSTNNSLNYLWNFGDMNTSVEQNPNHTYVGSGIYNVSLITRNCIFSDTVTFQIQIGSTGINENELEKLKAYPNPSKGIVYIKNINNSSAMNYILYSVTGEIIFRGRTLNDEIILDLRDLPNGLYLLRTLEKNSQPIKIIKE